MKVEEGRQPPNPPSELAHAWPAILFGLALVAMFVSLYPPLDWVRLVSGAFLLGTFPACLIRDWWIDSHYAGTKWSRRGHRP